MAIRKTQKKMLAAYETDGFTDVLMKKGHLVFVRGDVQVRRVPVAQAFVAPDLQAALENNLNAWDDEEDSVKEEHAGLIEETRAVIAKARGA